jgi:outer membrane protein OmpA-like peptidoglycan-associated protein
MLMIGTALLLQACETGGNDIAVTNQVAAMPYGNGAAQEMTGDGVRVFGLDEPTETPAIFNEAGPGYPAVNPDAKVGTDPNVQVFPLDAPSAPASYQPGNIPPLMAPAAEVPYQSPFPAGQAPQGAIRLRPPGASDNPLAPVTPDNGAVQLTPLSSAAPSSAVPSYGYAPPGMVQADPHVSRIYFSHGSSNLSGAGKQVVSDVAQRQSQYNPGGLVAVEAHASSRAEASDPVERRIVNLKMSMDRAYKVSSALIRAGVPATSIRTTAYGDTRPAAPLPGVSAEDASRRVEILTGE